VGHHGEAGTAKIKMLTADEVAEKMILAVIEDLPYQSGDEVAVMINGLGGTPQLELYICYRRVKQILDEKGIKVGHSLVGEFFTGLEMAGFSVTLMKLDAELKELLAAPADSPCFKVIA
jgi:dihydroxyacetone kinase-like protein